jgi:hypothetical protein
MYYCHIQFVLFQGGGAGGAVRSAGGAFGKLEAGREEEYFHRLVSFMLVLCTILQIIPMKPSVERFRLFDNTMCWLQQAAQLKGLKNDLDREIEHHRKQLEQHQAAIDRHKRRIAEIAHEEEQLKKWSPRFVIVKRFTCRP